MQRKRAGDGAVGIKALAECVASFEKTVRGLGAHDVQWTSALRGPEWNGDGPQQASMKTDVFIHCLPIRFLTVRDGLFYPKFLKYDTMKSSG